MANQIATLCTPWVNTSGVLFPEVCVDYPAYASVTDVTNQVATPSPNTVCVEYVADEAVVTQVEADSKYNVLSVEFV